MGMGLRQILALVGNLVRVHHLKWDVFEFVHVYVWQTIFILFVVCIWLLWIEKIVKKRRRREFQTQQSSRQHERSGSDEDRKGS